MLIINTAELELELAYSLMCKLAHVMTGGLSAAKLTHPQWRAGRGREILLLVTTVTVTVLLHSAVKNIAQISPLSNVHPQSHS